jgi:hypothetical protein
MGHSLNGPFIVPLNFHFKNTFLKWLPFLPNSLLSLSRKGIEVREKLKKGRGSWRATERKPPIIPPRTKKDRPKIGGLWIRREMLNRG